MKSEKQVPSVEALPGPGYPYDNFHVLMINWWLENTETLQQFKQLSSVFETVLNLPNTRDL